MVSQNSLRYYGRIGYDDSYHGLALDDAEGDRMGALVQDNDILFLANHGVVVTAESVAVAFDDLYYLERACMIQVLAEARGQPLKLISDDRCQETQRQILEAAIRYEKCYAKRKFCVREISELGDYFCLKLFFPCDMAKS